jgi:hypothetical protein
MSYSKKYDTRIPEINQRIHEFLREKHLTGQVEHEFQTRDPNTPTGWAILTVDTSDPMLQGELHGFISTLEKLNAAESGWTPEREQSLANRSYQTR